MINIQDDKTSKWGYYNPDNGEIISCQFDNDVDFIGDVAIVKINRKYGLIDKTGKEILPFIFSKIEIHDKGIFKVYGNLKYVSYYNIKGEMVDEKGIKLKKPLCNFAIAKPLTDVLSAVQTVYGDCGVFYKGNIIIQNDSFEFVEANYSFIHLKIGNNAQSALFDYSGKELLKGDYKYILVNEQYIIISKYFSGRGYLYGISNDQGEIILEPKYTKVEYKGDDIFALDYPIEDNGEIQVDFDPKDKTLLIKSHDNIIKLILEFDYASNFHDNYALVAKDYKFGLINKELSLLVPCEYDSLKYGFNDTYIAKKENEYSLVCPNGRIICQYYVDIQNLGDGFFQVKDRDNNYGIIDFEGRIILQLRYKYPFVFIKEKKLFKCEGKNICYFDTNGHVVIYQNKEIITLSKEIVWLNNFLEGLAVGITKDGMQGVIKENGEIVIPFRFNVTLSDFNNGISTITLRRQIDWTTYIEDSCVIDRNGKFICRKEQAILNLESDLVMIKDFKDDVAPAFNGDKWGLISIQNQKISSFIFDGIENLSSNMFKVYSLIGKENNLSKRYGVLNSKGELLIDCKYKDIRIEGKNKIKCITELGYRDKAFEFALFDFNGLMQIQYDDKIFYVKTDYDIIKPFKGDFAKAKKNGKWGLIDKFQNIKIDFTFDAILDINRDLVHCRLNNKDFIIPISNPKTIIAIPETEEIKILSPNLILLSKKETYSPRNISFGLCDMSGKRILPTEYASIELLEEGYLKLCKRKYKDCEYGLANPKGEIIIDCKYPYLDANIKKKYVKIQEDKKINFENERFKYLDFKGRYVMPSIDENVVIPDGYSHGGIFNDGYAIVGKKRPKEIIKDDELGDYEIDYDDPFLNLFHTYPVNKFIWGIVNTKFDEVINCHYDSVTPLYEGKVIVSKNHLFGVLDIDGKEIIPLEYEHISFLTSEFLKASKKEKYGIINLRNEIIIPLAYEDISCPAEDLIAVAKKNTIFDLLTNDSKTINENKLKETRWGYIDFNNNWVIKKLYTVAKPFSEGFAAVYLENKWQVIDIKGNVIIDNLFVNDIENFKNGRSTVTLKDDNKSIKHILLKNGNLLINDLEIKIDFSIIKYVSNFHNGFALISTNGETGFINTSGEIIVPLTERSFSQFENGYAYFETSEFGHQKINTEGKLVIENLVLPSNYTQAKRISDGLILVAEGSFHRGIINDDLETIIPPIHHELNIIEDKHFGVYFIIKYDDETCLYLDRNGRQFIPDASKRVYLENKYIATQSVFSDGLAGVRGLNGLWGFVDLMGKEIISCKFASVSKFKKNFCEFDQDYKKGLIDKQGDIIIKPGDYSEILVEGNGFRVKHSEFGKTEYWRDTDGEVIDSEWIPEERFFNLKGELLVSPYGRTVALSKDYEWCDDSFKEGFLSVMKKGKWGSLNTSLTLIVECKYNEKIIFKDGLAIIKNEDLFTFIRNDGEVIFSVRFNIIDRFHEFKMLRGLVQINEGTRWNRIKKNICIDFYDECGMFLFHKTSISSRIIIDDNFSVNYFQPIEIIPIHHDYLKFLISFKHGDKIIKKWGLCDRKGTVLVEAQFDDIESYGNGILTVVKHTNYVSKATHTRLNRLLGYSDIKGNLITDFIFKEALPFSHGLARVRTPESHYWGLIGTDGKFVKDEVYSNISDFNNENECTVVFNSNRKRNTITEQGLIHYGYWEKEYTDHAYFQDVYLFDYDWCSDIYDDICIVKKGNLQGIIEKNGSEVLKLTDFCDVNLEIENNKIVFKKKKDFKYIAQNGGIITHLNDNVVILPKGICWCDNWVDGYICVEMEGKWGVLNENLDIILECQFEYTQYAGNNKIFCIINEDGKKQYFLFDIINQKFITLDFDHVGKFEQNHAIVSKCIKETKSYNGESKKEFLYGLLNCDGNLKLDCIYRNIQFVKPSIKRTFNHNYYSDYDYRQESWDAMTDGQYGDMSDDFSGDFDFLG